MMLLVEILAKFSFKHENDSHSPAAFQAFWADVSALATQLLMNSEPEGTLAWVKRGLEMLPLIHKAFAKLVVEIDHPVSRWEAAVTEEYLNYSLNVLEMLNSVASSVSHLSQARFELSHGLNLAEDSLSSALRHLKRIKTNGFTRNDKLEGVKYREEKLTSSKGLVVHRALLMTKRISHWIFAVILSGLSGDIKPDAELRKSAARFNESLPEGLASRFSKGNVSMHGEMKEVKEVNDAIANLVSDILGKNRVGDAAANELKRSLEILEEVLMNIGKEINYIFSEILAARNELLDGLRRAASGKA